MERFIKPTVEKYKKAVESGKYDDADDSSPSTPKMRK